MSDMTAYPGTDEKSDLSPVIDEVSSSRLGQWAINAEEAGADINSGGRILWHKSHPARFYYSSAILTSVPPGTTLVKEEIVEPVLPVINVANNEEALQRANNSAYGIIGYLFTNSCHRIATMSERLPF